MIGALLAQLYDEARRIWYYRTLAAITAVLILAPVTTYALWVPNVYEAWAQIYVSKQTPVAAATQGVSLVGENYGSAYLVEKTLLNDQYLEKVALKLNPSLRGASKLEMAGALVALRQKITITPDQGDGFFEVHVRDRDPVRAKTVVQLMLDEFVSRNMNHNQAELRTAGAFIDAQLASYQEQIEASQARIAEFRQRNPTLGAIPSPISTGSPSDLPAAREAYQAALAAAGAPDREQKARADEAVAAARGRLAGLRTQYTDEHPDVIAAKRQLDQAIGDRAAALALDGPSGSVGSPALDEARRRLAKAQSSSGFRGPAGPSPVLKSEWTDLLKNDETLHNSYQALLARREATRLSEAVYGGDNTGKYQVMRQPTVPDFPVGPKRPLYLAAGVILALGGGLGAAYLRAAINGIFVSPRELERAFDLPVVGTVSWESAWSTRTPHRLRSSLAGSNAKGRQRPPRAYRTSR